MTKNSTKKIPRLRFKGFEGEWEEKRLGDVSDRITRKNNKLESKLPLTISAQNGLIDQKTFFNKKVASKNLENYILIKNGEFAYNKSYSRGFPFGAIKRLDFYNKGVLSSLYIAFRPKNINSDFLASYYNSSYWYREISRISTEGARNHGLLNISPIEFFNSKLNIPISLNEQEKIGSFFAKLDQLIDLQSKKVEQLKKLKRGYLQKMFPQKGESIPRLRFDGFNGKWNIYKLGNLYNVGTGYPFKSKQFVPYGKYMVVTNMNVNDDSKYVLNNVENYLNISDKKIIYKYHLKKYDILITMDGNVGRSALVDDDNMLLAQRVGRIYFDNVTSIDFLYEYLNTTMFKNYMNRSSIGGIIKHISLNDIKNFSIKIPPYTLNEKNIGYLFYYLDKIINLNNNKLLNIKELKSAYLQKLFC